VLEDIGTIIATSHDLQDTLESIVRVVAERMQTEVCSLYIYDRGSRADAVGDRRPDRDSVGKVRMRIDEGSRVSCSSARSR